jgi:hypothetical protein
VLDQLITIDYQEGAGGEFIANWLSAHFGQRFKTDLQSDPDYLQKWLNSHSLVKHDWRENFNNYLLTFNKECSRHNIQKIAVSYHLYKYPEHVEILKKVNRARFVRINCAGYESQVISDFNRKILNYLLGTDNFAEIKFMLQGQSQEKIKHCLTLFSQRKLTYRDLINDEITVDLKYLPSNDIEIMYEDFFIDFNKTHNAYKHLCDQLQLEPNFKLLDALIERNTKNLQLQKIV